MKAGARIWRLRAVAVAVAVLAVAGCGYRVGGLLPPHVRTVAVPVLVNQTDEPAVEGFLTRAIVDAFARNGRLQVVTPERADAVLEGELTNYVVSSIAFDPRVNVTQYRLTVTLNVRFRDVREQRMLFQQANLQEYADFRVFGQAADTIAREEGALQEAAAEIARTIVSLAIERF